MAKGSCIGCKFLMGDGDGYSDWTWMETNVTCCLGNNPNLPYPEPWASVCILSDPSLGDIAKANEWWPIAGMQCDKWSPGPYIVVSPEGMTTVQPVDADQREAIESVRPGVEWA